MDGVLDVDHTSADGRASALAALLRRKSVSTKLMGGPGPRRSELKTMVEVALRAPDRGSLRLWRFVCVEGEARGRLGDVFASAHARRNPDATPEQLARERSKPLRAPTVVAVVAAIRADHPLVRVVDQQLAAGAAAMNLLNAAHLLGYGGIWLTGERCHHPAVKVALGLAADDFMAGWIYLGTPQAEPPLRHRLGPEQALLYWEGPKA